MRMDPLTTNFVNPPNRKFGELYCNYMGVLTFHCVLCPTQMDIHLNGINHSDEFILHCLIHFRDGFQIKQEVLEDPNIFEPDVGIAESELLAAAEQAEEIKIELSQASTSVYSDIKSESKYFDDNYPSTDHSFSEVESSHSSKLKLINPKKCGICGQTFVVRKFLKDHIRIHQAGPVPKFYQCDVCGRRVNQKKNLLTHIRRRHGKKIKCKICGKMLRQHYMVAHVRRHNNERNFKCMLCDKAFVMAGELTSHLKLHYSAPPEKQPSSKKFLEPQTCSVCGQKFIGISAYERHIQSHGTTPSLYECDICGGKVKEKKNLRSHMLTLHSGLPKVKVPCTICGKVFGRKYLNLHVRKHNVLDRKPSHMCPICGKTFLVSGDLSAHIRQHNKVVETAPCTVCGKSFAIPGPLSDHIRVHTGERPFPCQICGTRFRTKNMLYVHRTIHWTGKNFACDICDMKFKNPAGVRSHKRKVHGKKITTRKRRYNDFVAPDIKQENDHLNAESGCNISCNNEMIQSNCN